jgi:hypothetical protein
MIVSCPEWSSFPHIRVHKLVVHHHPRHVPPAFVCPEPSVFGGSAGEGWSSGIGSYGGSTTLAATAVPELPTWAMLSVWMAIVVCAHLKRRARPCGR